LMSRSQAIRSGVKSLVRQPLVIIAELAWRWSLATAMLALSVYSLLLFLHSTPVTNGDMFGLSGIVPSLFWQTLVHIFRGSGPKLVRISVLLLAAFSMLWWLAASTGRAATLQALTSHDDAAERRFNSATIRTILKLNGLRVLLAFVGMAS